MGTVPCDADMRRMFAGLADQLCLPEEAPPSGRSEETDFRRGTIPAIKPENPYHGVSYEEALAGFNTIPNCRECLYVRIMPNGNTRTYQGSNCSRPHINYRWSEPRPGSGEAIISNGKKTGAKFTIDGIFTITLEYNKICYPTSNESSDNISRKLYLHERGHQLDSISIVSNFDARLVLVQLPEYCRVGSQETVIDSNSRPQKVITIKAEGVVIDGKNDTEINNKMKAWLRKTNEELHAIFGRKLGEDSTIDTDIYHSKWGRCGNPWEGYFCNGDVGY